MEKESQHNKNTEKMKNNIVRRDGKCKKNQRGNANANDNVATIFMLFGN
jgi:hypothetical protein